MYIRTIYVLSILYLTCTHVRFAWLLVFIVVSLVFFSRLLFNSGHRIQ
jgi:hypothetical protein